MKKIFLLLSLIAFYACHDTTSGSHTADQDGRARQNEKMNLLEELIHNEPSLNEVISKAEKHEIQILYTQIDRDENNFPHFTSYAFRIDSSQYFYPASTVKMPAAILALEKINRLKKLPGMEALTPFTPLRIDSSRVPQTSVAIDSTAENRLPSIAHFAKKIFVVSDNDANNRLYEFLGQDYLNAQLRAKGFKDTKIIHRLGPEGAPFGPVENKFTNAFTFYERNTFDESQKESVIYQQAEAMAKNQYTRPIKNTLKGKGYMENGKLIDKPKDFSSKNFFPLTDMQSILKSVLFPEAVPSSARFDLAEADYKNLYKWMGMRPGESRFPDYSKEKEEDGSDHFYDSYVKFHIYGTSKDPMPEHVRIFNKVGWAYGYLTDCAYVVDFDKNVEFLLAATIHVNENQIYNDDNYEYEPVGLPFFANLGKLIYDYEVKRIRQNQPDLSRFMIKFDESL